MTRALAFPLPHPPTLGKKALTFLCPPRGCPERFPRSTAKLMDASFLPKRRHHHHHHQPPPPSSASPAINISVGEIVFRILCQTAQAGSITGKGGAFIRQVREETGARIRVEDSFPGCKERVIVIVAESTEKERSISENTDANGDESLVSEAEVSHGQQALVRVFERIVKADEERSGVSNSTESEKGEERDCGGGGGVGMTAEGAVVCRLLAPSNQVGCVLGRGGRIVERIRHESGARVRVLQYDQIPACAFPGDELIQVKF